RWDSGRKKGLQSNRSPSKGGKTTPKRVTSLSPKICFAESTVDAIVKPMKTQRRVLHRYSFREYRQLRLQVPECILGSNCSVSLIAVHRGEVFHITCDEEAIKGMLLLC